jgi:hypothetical protein
MINDNKDLEILDCDDDEDKALQCAINAAVIRPPKWVNKTCSFGIERKKVLLSDEMLCLLRKNIP